MGLKSYKTYKPLLYHEDMLCSIRKALCIVEEHEQLNNSLRSNSSVPDVLSVLIYVFKMFNDGPFSATWDGRSFHPDITICGTQHVDGRDHYRIIRDDEEAE